MAKANQKFAKRTLGNDTIPKNRAIVRYERKDETESITKS